MFIAATSFYTWSVIFKQCSENWHKITWFKQRWLPKRNYFQVACSILISILPQVTLIPNFPNFCSKCFPIFTHLSSVFIIIMFFHITNLFIPSPLRILRYQRPRFGYLTIICKSWPNLTENPSSWNLDLMSQAWVSFRFICKMPCYHQKSKTFLTA